MLWQREEIDLLQNIKLAICQCQAIQLDAVEFSFLETIILCKTGMCKVSSL